MANKREYDPKDALIYAWEKEDMYGCYNDVISLVYDRLICCGLLPRKPSGLCVDEKFSVQYGISYTRASASHNEESYSLKLFTTSKKQEELIKKVSDCLLLDCIKHKNYVEVKIPMKWAGVRIDKYLIQNKLPLEYGNRLGFMQYPGNSVLSRFKAGLGLKTQGVSWGKYDLCSIVMID